ncbi:MAG TPA: polyprenyl synthetase family protein [Gemmataceae bacterium]|nr:polyprenyl synthetase family protein [Gemmataceae bacterium]
MSKVDDELDQYLRDKCALVEESLRSALGPNTGCPESLLEAMRHSLLAPGKRLRPLLVILATEACGGEDRAALPAACAVEMIHTYSLIHDDLPAMDDDDLRRGLPTCHKQFGEALAILAGDALLTLAFQVLAEGYPPASGAACCRELAKGAGAAGMVGGQVEDLAWERVNEEACVCSVSDSRQQSQALLPPPSLLALENIHARKTGALFRACLRLGACVAQGEKPGGPNPILVDALDAYGRSFGQAFQVTDDLLDVEGSADQMGKRVQKDAARGKLTYPGFLGVAESRRRAQRLCEEARAHLVPLGAAANHLAALVDFVVERKR